MKTDATAKLPVFARRFRELRGERSQAKFSEDLGISRPTIGFYENGDRVPDALTLKIISEKCNVPSDWLIGLAENQMSDNIEIGRTTGLTDAAIGQIAGRHGDLIRNAGLAFNLSDVRHLKPPYHLQIF